MHSEARYQNNEQRERVDRAFLVGVHGAQASAEESNELLDELSELVDTLGIAVAGRLCVRLDRPGSRLFVGHGKAEEIIQEARSCGADVIVFDDALTPSQQRNWEALARLCVIDRQEVILDIFADRAQTREAVLQVRLAQARYDLPRLKRRWSHLSRQRGMRGGMGLRGEGEQQIEVDARIVRNRISRLRAQLAQVRKRRRVQRSRRQRKPVPVAALVGYTNAGKSSLLNALTQAGVLVENKLFATLDPTVRRIVLPNRRELLLSDTVGFIRKLPHQLVEAFKATLEETLLADAIIEVLDISAEAVEEHHSTTLGLLRELGIKDKPTILVFNKIDKVHNSYLLPRLRRRHPGSLFVSAKTGVGLDSLVQELVDRVALPLEPVEVMVPHENYDLIALIHRTSSILGEKHTPKGIRIQAEVPASVRASLEKFIVSP